MAAGCYITLIRYMIVQCPSNVNDSQSSPKNRLNHNVYVVFNGEFRKILIEMNTILIDHLRMINKVSLMFRIHENTNNIFKNKKGIGSFFEIWRSPTSTIVLLINFLLHEILFYKIS